MFTNLIESERKTEKSLGVRIFSIIVHALIVMALVAVTAGAGQKMKEKINAEDVKFAEVKKAPEAAKPPPEVLAPPPPKGFQVLTAPVNIPDRIPDVDLSKSLTDENDYTGKGVAGGTSKGVAPPTDQPLFEFQVEKPVLQKDGNPNPHYPDILQNAHVDGEVLIQFVVDTLGRAAMGTFKVLKTTNELFSQEVKRVLPYWKFYAAEAGGHKVQQYVQLPFVFKPIVK